ncbi:MAG: DUF1015 domain-containing protein [Actinobacteria bacterium]|nr:DUF1015 domain-containing protein [Actinomycetota bacterium]
MTSGAIIQAMAQVIAFRPWLYDTSVAGPLDRLVAPPYDVISPDLQTELYQRSPYNVVRVDLNREPGDRRYQEAARALAAWKEQGALRRATEPQVTVVEETFVGPDGHGRVRKGVLALLRLADFNQGVVFPHEFTLSGPKEDRFRLLEATTTGLSPIFLLYSRPDDAIMAAWSRQVNRPPDATLAAPAVREDGGQREIIRLWHTTNPSFLATLSTALSKQPLIIADGHHRYETALRYRDTKRAATADEIDDAPYEYVLAYLVNMSDPGLAIFGTHRLLHDIPRAVLATLPHCLTPYFAVEQVADSSTEAGPALRAFLERQQEHSSTAESTPTVFGLYIADTKDAYGLVLRPDAALLGHAASAVSRVLDVTVLQEVVLERCLGVSSEQVAAGAHVTFVKEWDEALQRLVDGSHQVGFFLNPTRLEQVHTMALGGERMPQKSTYFYPKLPTGLLFQDLADGI